MYSRPSLSRLRLSRITTYLEEKILSIRGEIVQHIFLIKGVKLRSFVKFGCSFGIFLSSANLICQSTEISKCFRGSLRFRDNERLPDNESRLYILYPALLSSFILVFTELSNTDDSESPYNSSSSSSTVLKSTSKLITKASDRPIPK